MSIDFLTNAQRFESAGLTTALAPSLTANASANTKGNYTELIASTAFNGAWLLVCTQSGTAAGYLVDIAIGAASSEQIIIANILNDTRGNTFSPRYFLVPLSIPAGTRISARCQSTTGGASIRCSVTVIAGAAIAPLGVAVTYGAATGDSGGLSVDPGGSAGTKGAYSELTSASTREISWLIIFIGGNQNTTRSGFGWGLDIAIGAAGSEQVIVADIVLGSNIGADEMGPAVVAFPCHIPAGSRIAARANCNDVDATDRIFDIVVIGVG